MTLLHPQIRFVLKAFGILLIGLFTISIQAEIDQEHTIQKPVIQLHETLIGMMKNVASTRFQERYALVEKIINEHFNTTLMSKVVLSRYWKSLDEESQYHFIDLFNRLTILTYVDRFDSFNNESFNNLSVKPMKKNRFMVRTELLSPNNEPVLLDYLVQNEGAQWKIVNIIANGFNALSLKRAEYSSVIKNHGFDVLVRELEEKIYRLSPE